MSVSFDNRPERSRMDGNRHDKAKDSSRPSDTDPRLEAVERIVETAFRARLGDGSLLMPGQYWFWDASHFSLENSTLFRKLDDRVRETVLVEASQMVLGEAYFIEDAGMRFAAKMNLSSQTQQERMFYSLMSGEEATHLRMIMPFLARKPILSDSPFAAFIGQVIDQGSRESLLLLIQVVLEGLGLNHYSKLAKTCQDEDLGDILRQVLKDEGRHHGMGLVLGSFEAVAPNERAFVVERLMEILNMVRIGPAGFIRLVDRATGGLSRPEKRLLLEQTRAALDTQMKLELLKSLIKSCVDERSMVAIDERGLFKAISMDQAAELL